MNYVILKCSQIIKYNGNNNFDNENEDDSMVEAISSMKYELKNKKEEMKKLFTEGTGQSAPGNITIAQVNQGAEMLKKEIIDMFEFNKTLENMRLQIQITLFQKTTETAIQNLDRKRKLLEQQLIYFQKSIETQHKEKVLQQFLLNLNKPEDPQNQILQNIQKDDAQILTLESTNNKKELTLVGNQDVTVDNLEEVIAKKLKLIEDAKQKLNKNLKTQVNKIKTQLPIPTKIFIILCFMFLVLITEEILKKIKIKNEKIKFWTLMALNIINLAGAMIILIMFLYYVKKSMEILANMGTIHISENNLIVIIFSIVYIIILIFLITYLSVLIKPFIQFIETKTLKIKTSVKFGLICTLFFLILILVSYKSIASLFDKELAKSLQMLP